MITHTVLSLSAASHHHTYLQWTQLSVACTFLFHHPHSERFKPQTTHMTGGVKIQTTDHSHVGGVKIQTTDHSHVGGVKIQTTGHSHNRGCWELNQRPLTWQGVLRFKLQTTHTIRGVEIQTTDHSHNRGCWRSDAQVVPEVDGFTRGDDALWVRCVYHFAHCLGVTNEHLGGRKQNFVLIPFTSFFPSTFYPCYHCTVTCA